MTRLFLCLAAVTAACGDNITYDLYEDEPGDTKTVTVWVDPHPEADAAFAAEACEAWRPEGIVCEAAASRYEALIRIHAYAGACEERDDGTYVLAYAVEGGDITLMIECLRKFGGTPIDPDLLWPTIAHEVGHELGIWWHVDPKAGIALMNPMVHDGLYGITELDHEAYLMRDKDGSVIGAAPRSCILTAR
jgi:hypothetical protein